MKMKKSGKLVFSMALVLLSVPAFGDLLFSAPPRGTEAQERATYEPLAKAMSQWIGTKVVYEYPRDFMTYSFRTRAGRYDLQFDGPHFAAWRMSHLHQKVLVNLPEKLVFVVIAPVANPKITNLESLVARRVCGQASPQLGTLILMSQFHNPAREPILKVVLGEANVYKSLKSGVCSAAVLRNKTYLNFSEAERAQYRVLYTSRPVPNNALTAGPRVTSAQSQTLIERLTDPVTASVAKPLFERFSKNADSFEPAVPANFEGLDELLKDYSFGW